LIGAGSEEGDSEIALVGSQAFKQNADCQDGGLTTSTADERGQAFPVSQIDRENVSLKLVRLASGDYGKEEAGISQYLA
jgi:hypothetical protein